MNHEQLCIVISAPFLLGLVQPDPEPRDQVRYPWQKFLLDAYLAPREDLPEKIAVSQREIAKRIEAGEFAPDERLAIDDALMALQVLNQETTWVSPKKAPVLKGCKDKLA